MAYDKKDVPQFQKDMCSKCVLKGKCIEEGKDDHWFLMCPHYHQWKLGYTSFVMEQMDWQREHPEENEAKCKERAEYAKRVKEQIKASKKKEKETK